MSQSNLQIRTTLYVEHAELAGISEQWQALSVNALEQNINYDPIPLLGLLNSEPYGGWCVVTFWSDDQLLGLFPLQRVKGYPVPLEQYTSVFANYFLKCVPLVHKQHAEVVVGAFVDWINSDKGKIFVFNESMEGSVYRSLLLDTLAKEKNIVQNVQSYDRAAVTETNQTYEDYLLTAFKAKSRSTLKRKRKKLHASGSYRLEICHDNDPERVKRLVDETIDVEGKSWKKENGSAMICRSDIMAFAHDTAQYAAKNDRLFLAVSYLDDVAVAAYYGLENDGSLMCWKIGYDDDYSEYSPGHVLMLEVVEYCLQHKKYAVIDSCAADDATMFNRTLQQRIGLEKYHIGSTHLSATLFLRLIHGVKKRLKRVRAKLREVRKTK